MASVFKNVSDALKSLPGIGHKSAQRILFHLLETDKRKSLHLAAAIVALAENTSRCRYCGLVSEHNPCRICSNPQRKQQTICVVKNVQDALIIERSGAYKGLYHVLGDFYAELQENEPTPEPLKKLLARLKSARHTELLFAFESGLAGENTIRFVRDTVKHKINRKLLFSKMAVGVPLGAGLEHIDDDTIRQSIEHRYSLK